MCKLRGKGSELLSDTQNHKSVKTRVNTEEPYIRH